MTIRSFFLDNPIIYNACQAFFGLNFVPIIISEIIGPHPHRSVLEIGCGTGEFVNHLQPDRYVGVDINPSYIRHDSEHFSGANRKFLLLDAKKLPVMSRPFDVVCMINMVHHLSDSDFRTIIKRLVKNVRFKTLIIIDGKPDAGILSPLLTWADQGEHFRELATIQALCRPLVAIDQAFVFRKWYWFYKSPIIIARKKA